MKTPKKLTTEELLEQLEEAHDVDAFSELSDDHSKTSEILSFISHFELEPGEYLIHQKYMFSLYKSFSKNPMNQRSFFRMLSTVYPYKNTSYTFKVNRNIQNLLRFAKQNKSKSSKLTGNFNHRRVSTVKKFLDSQDIGPGNNWVESFVLYAKYKEYMKETRSPKYADSTLTRIISMLVETYRVDDSVWFKLSKNSLDILGELRYNELLQDRGKEWYRKNRKKEELITEENEPDKNLLRIRKEFIKGKRSGKRKNTQH